MNIQLNNQLINILKKDCLNMIINHLHDLKFFLNNYDIIY